MNVSLTLVGTLAEITAVLNASQNAGVKATVAPAAKKQAETADGTEEEEDKPVKSAAPAPKAAAAKGPAPKAAAAKGPAPKAAPKAQVEEAVPFEEMDEEAQLAEIVRLSTTFTKKGRSADIRTLVGIFYAARASELDPAVYSEFYALLNRMKAGESAEDLAAENAV